MTNRIIFLMIISLLLIVIDLYIYKAVKAVYKKWTARQKKVFKYSFWTYSILLTLAVFATMFLNIRLAAKSVILVAFFLTFVSKLVFLLFLFTDDIRRGVIWIKRKLIAKDSKTAPSPSTENTIPRSEFLVKAGTLVAALPLASLSYGMVSGAYDYRVVKRPLILPNLPASFEGLTLGQISDVHSGSFYNRKAVLGGVEMLLGAGSRPSGTAKFRWVKSGT